MTQTLVADRKRAGGTKAPMPIGAIGIGSAFAAGGALMMNDVPLVGAAACVAPPLAVVGFTQWRAAKRRQLRTDLTQGLAPLAGNDVIVKCSQWAKRQYLDPRPGRIEIRYSAAARDADPKWLQQVTETISARVGRQYEVEKHRSERKRIWLTPGGREQKNPEQVSPLEQRADVVMNETLGKDSLPTYVWDKDGNLSRIDVTYPDEIAVKLVSRMKRQSIERVVTGMLPGRWRSDWDVKQGTAVFRLRTEFPSMVPHPKLEITDDNRFRIPSAVTEDEETVVWDLKSTVPHGLTTGKTGTGKTVVLLGTCMEWAGRDWAVWVGDPKRVEFLGIRKWPNVQHVATSVENMIAMVWDAFELMEYRYQLIENSGADEDDFEPILVLLDEYTEFRSAVTAWWSENKHKGAPAKCPIFNAVGSLARLARKARIHLRFGMQRPDAELLTGEVRDNLGDRHSLGRLSPNGAQMMWEAAYIGTSVPRSIPGRGTAVGPDGQPAEAQAYWTPDPRKVARSRGEEDIAILEGLYPTGTTHKRFEYEIEDEDATTWLDDSGKSTLYTPWAAVTQARRVPAKDVDRHYSLQELLDELSEAREKAAKLASTTAPPPEEREERQHLRLVREDGEDAGDGYGPMKTVAADRLRPGDLIEMDDQWVAVEEAVVDLEDDAMVCVSWRSDDDDAGDLELSAGEMLQVRQAEEEDE
ncbi:MAG: FtsK/SpoIIIE domain-containing protein [Brachybacterium tyrofermentans]